MSQSLSNMSSPYGRNATSVLSQRSTGAGWASDTLTRASASEAGVSGVHSKGICALPSPYLMVTFNNRGASSVRTVPSMLVLTPRSAGPFQNTGIAGLASGVVGAVHDGEIVAGAAVLGRRKRRREQTRCGWCAPPNRRSWRGLHTLLDGEVLLLEWQGRLRLAEAVR